MSDPTSPSFSRLRTYSSIRAPRPGATTPAVRVRNFVTTSSAGNGVRIPYATGLKHFSVVPSLKRMRSRAAPRPCGPRISRTRKP